MSGRKFLRLKARVRSEAFGGLLVSMERSRILALNPTAYRIASMLEAGCPLGTITRELAASCSMPKSVVHGDVHGFLEFLDGQGLIERA